MNDYSSDILLRRWKHHIVVTLEKKTTFLPLRTNCHIFYISFFVICTQAALTEREINSMFFMYFDTALVLMTCWIPPIFKFLEGFSIWNACFFFWKIIRLTPSGWFLYALCDLHVGGWNCVCNCVLPWHVRWDISIWIPMKCSIIKNSQLYYALSSFLFPPTSTLIQTGCFYIKHTHAVQCFPFYRHLSIPRYTWIKKIILHYVQRTLHLRRHFTTDFDHSTLVISAVIPVT